MIAILVFGPSAPLVCGRQLYITKLQQPNDWIRFQQIIISRHCKVPSSMLKSFIYELKHLHFEVSNCRFYYQQPKKKVSMYTV